MKVRSSLLVFLLLFAFSLGTAATAVAAPSQQAQYALPKLIVNTSFLNVRTGPGVQYTVLLTVVGGTELPVVARANDGVWYQVSTAVGLGWVNIEYTVARGTFTNIPVLSLEDVIIAAAQTPITLGLNDAGQGGGGGAPTTTSTTPVVGSPMKFTLASGQIVTVSPGERFRAVINVEAVNARSQPVDGAPAITTLFRNDTFDYTIVGSTNDKNGVNWVALDVPDVGVGWVEGAKLFIRLSRVSGQVVSIAGNAIAMRDLPGGGSQQLPVLNEGREGFLRDISKDSQFVLIELGDGTRGWVPFNATVGRTGTPTDEIDLSLLQSTASDLGQGGGGGAPVSFGLATPHVVVNTGFLNVRSGPGAQFGIVATFAGGSELPVIGITTDGVWFLVEGTFGQGWLNSEFTVFRGSITSVPIINTTGN
ncbi:MAG: SH3 domain-containing protein [Chloroflexi bacterium]|nr:SH3 domain-containing protein [Chloroflexota bacterium]MCC6891308.1 SH3 domain-containing protein [Anaerolineae bacterium]